MLGNQVLEITGKVTSQRVLQTPDGTPKMETSVQANEKILGIDASTTMTYTSVVRPDGTIAGTGNAVVMTADGGLATWTGQGAGKVIEGGSVSSRGALFYQTASPSLASLNGIGVVFEFEVDAEGNAHGIGWEWK